MNHDLKDRGFVISHGKTSGGSLVPELIHSEAQECQGSRRASLQSSCPSSLGFTAGPRTMSSQRTYKGKNSPVPLPQSKENIARIPGEQHCSGEYHKPMLKLITSKKEEIYITAQPN